MKPPRWAAMLVVLLGGVAIGRYSLSEQRPGADGDDVEQTRAARLEKRRATSWSGMRDAVERAEPPPRSPTVAATPVEYDAGLPVHPIPPERAPEGSAQGPRSSESSGQLRALYERWASESSDEEASLRAERYLDDMFDAHEINAFDREVRCGDSLCRSEMSFDNLREMRNLGRIAPSTDIEVV